MKHNNFEPKFKKDIIRLFDISTGTNKPGNTVLHNFLADLEKKDISYQVELDKENKVVMVIAYDYLNTKEN